MAGLGFWAAKQRVSFALTQMLKANPAVARLYMLRQQMTRRGKKRALFFPSRMNTGHAGDLRAVALARELEHFGWRAIVVPNWLSLEERQRMIRKERPHVLYLQQSVHALNRPALYPGAKTVFDADDADYVMEPELVGECCRTASVSTVANRHMAEVFRGFGATAVEVVWTSTYMTEVAGMRPNGERGPVITWAHSAPQDYPMEAELVRRVMLRVAAKRPFRFRVYGNRPEWLETYAAPMRAAGVEVEIFGTRRYSEFIRSLADAAVGLQPVVRENAFSMGKSFGKLLAYMAADVAVVASDEVDHPMFFRTGENGMLATTEEEWAEACLRLLDHPEERQRMVEAARKDFLERLTTRAVARRLSGIMDGLVPEDVLQER